MAETTTPTPLRVRRFATKPILKTFMFRSSLEKLRPLERLVLTISPSRTSTGRSLFLSSRSTSSEMVVFPEPDRPVNHSVKPRSSFMCFPFDALTVCPALVYTFPNMSCSYDDSRIGGGEPIGVVELGAFWSWDVSFEERVFGIYHPRFEPPAQLLQRIGVRGVSREVVRLVWVEHDVVELLLGDLALAPPVGEEKVLARAVVGVREDRPGPVAEAPDVLPAVGTHTPLGFVGDMVGLLREDGLPDLIRLPASDRQQRLALQPLRRVYTGEIADRREEVYVGDEGVARLAARKTSRPAQDEHDAEPPVVEGCFGAWEGEAVICRADDERVVGQSFCVEGVQNGPYAPVQRPRALLEGGHVEARL